MAMEIAELPYWEIRFDEQGSLVDDGQLPAQLPDRRLSDLFVFCYGWNNSVATARDLYQAMFTLLSEQVGGHAVGRLVGTVGIFWPSLVFPEDDPTALPAAAPTGRQLAQALAPAFIPPRQQALGRIGELLDTKTAEPGKRREAHSLICSLVTSPHLDATEDSGEKAVLTQPTTAVFGHFAGMSKTQDVLRVASYYEMKNRAGVIGQSGLGPLISQLVPRRGRPAHPSARAQFRPSAGRTRALCGQCTCLTHEGEQ